MQARHGRLRTFGLGLVPAGRAGDRYGYKRLFLAGLILFTVASVACGAAENAGELIAARLVQGLGAGIYYPAISAIIGQRLVRAAGTRKPVSQATSLGREILARC